MKDTLKVSEYFDRPQISVDEEIISEARKTGKSVWDILFFSENVEKYLDLVSKLDEMLKNGKTIANSFEYNIFCNAYFTLTDTDIMNINSVVKAEFWSVYDEFKKIYLTEKVLNNISNKCRFSEDLKNYLSEYERLLEKDDFSEIYDSLETSEQKELFVNYLENYRNS